MKPRFSAHRLAVAPMMDCTDRHDRYLLRCITRRALLYTEMITTGALIHGNRDRFLGHDPFEHPLALQLGGSSPVAMAECASLAAEHGFDEVNINVGCPSDRVQNGRFGACLMAEPVLVADCVRSMRERVDIPVTVKTRIGIDDRDSMSDLECFIETVAEAGCKTFIIHARKAWLSGLSPKQNREIPPLRYEMVFAIKRAYPDLEVVLNGGLTSTLEARPYLTRVDGVMIGREAYRNPYMLAQADALFFDEEATSLSRAAIVERYLPYVARQLDRGVHLSALTRHMLGLFQGVPGARAWRRHLSEHAHRKGAGAEVIDDALAKVAQHQRRDLDETEALVAKLPND